MRALLRPLFVLSALALVPVVQAATLPVATGSGHLRLADGNLRTFTFHAQQLEDGTVRGRGVIHNRTRDNKVVFDISCLQVSGNTATMTGIVTDTTDPLFTDGPCWFRVVDNGEGNASGDVMTLVGIFPAGTMGVTCGLEVGLELMPIEEGNIQVR